MLTLCRTTSSVQQQEVGLNVEQYIRHYVELEVVPKSTQQDASNKW